MNRWKMLVESEWAIQCQAKGKKNVGYILYEATIHGNANYRERLTTSIRL